MEPPMAVDTPTGDEVAAKKLDDFVEELAMASL
jgi:hypothetical protein